MRKDAWAARVTRVAPYLILLLVAFLMGPTYPRDDTGTPAAQCSFIGSAGTPTLCSTTDPLPSGGPPTQSTTDPTGFGKQFFLTNDPFGTDRASTVPVFVTDQTVLAFTLESGGVPEAVKTYLSLNGGRTYALSSTSLVTFNMTGLVDALRTTQGLYIIGGTSSDANDGYLRSSDGVSWTQVDLPGIVAAQVNSIGQQGTTVLVSVSVGGNLQVCRSTNSGTSFSSCSDPGALVLAANWANALASPSASIWLVGDGSGNVARSTDDGVTFSVVLSGIGTFSTVTCVSSTVCLVADGGTIRRSTNAGATFTTVLSVDTSFATFRALLNFGSGVVVALSSIPVGGPTLYRSADFGATWGLASTLPNIASATPGSAKANGGRAVVGTTGANDPILYSPVIGAGETIIAGQSGNRWDIDTAGRGFTRSVITDSAGTTFATVSGGLRVQVGTVFTTGGNAKTCSTPAANTAASISVAGVANQRVNISSYIAYYTTAPAVAQTLTITDAATTIWQDIVALANTPTRHAFGSPPLYATTANTMTITLPAGGVGVSGVLCAVMDQFQL